ncbi:ketopantoate reductase family protein [Halanaerobiaceae bacterium Z-7014]|uniref:Ketopantoate reductase family protein n=1 Tax=Halonatronomonas betaini TaxID=2778430 RepID=A0A931AUS5_9FIRM|nr:2-dehydropantoate 2-reductase N-terminal domain-containing protein [Halonatronomonas betaini]MBF8436880.1 ketopantoate reductase family protein [Halonatronomonas betaini]
MKTLIFGAGPLGTLMAARLNEADEDVTLLARGKRLEDLKEYGAIINIEGTEIEEVEKVKVVDSFNSDDYYDLVIIAMRKNHADLIIPDLAKNKNVPTYLFMGNNAAGPEELIAALGKDRVMLGFPYPGGHREDPKVVVLKIDEKKQYKIPIGEVDGKIRPRTEAVAGLLRKMRGYKVEIRTDMVYWLKYHAAMLMSGFVPAIYASGIDMKKLGNDKELLYDATKATKEAIKALELSGIPPSPKVIKVFKYIPNFLMVALIGWMMRKEFAKSSVEGHPRDARDEMEYIYRELMTNIDRNKVDIPSIDKLSKYYSVK